MVCSFVPRRANAAKRLRLRAAVVCLLAACGMAAGQVITIDTNSKGPVAATGPVDRRFQQVTPTKVPLTETALDAKTRLELIRQLTSEQGFAMRPFPRGHKGLTLIANGPLDPAGEAYLNMVTSEGVSAKPGDRLVLSDIKIEHSRIVIDLNGGPDQKHRFLRHISVGGPDMEAPVVRDSGEEATGSRLTLWFKNQVPELTDKEVKALLAPLIEFDVKTPIQAFTDTLPKELKDAILNHHVLVGMTTDMVLFAKGQPGNKTREMDGQEPFEEWIYGKPPQDVEFVRINGNRVIRLEVAKVGEKPVVYTTDEVAGLMRTDGTAIVTERPKTRTVAEGDVERDPNKEAPAAPPSLRKPGETLPTDDQKVGVMKPVQMPKPKPAAQPGENPDGEPDAAQPNAGDDARPTLTKAPASGGTAAPPTPAQQNWQSSGGAA